MTTCFLPEFSNIEELQTGLDNELTQVEQFDKTLQDNIRKLLGNTFLLPEVMALFSAFAQTATNFHTQIILSANQQKAYDPNNKFDIYDKYFGVLRIKSMTWGQFIRQYLNTSVQLIDEMQFTAMSRGEIAYILKGWEAANGVLLSALQNPKNTLSEKTIRCDIPADKSDHVLYRWKLAHHGFGLFMILSGYCFEQATRIINNHQDEDRIADWLDKGAHLFRATTACMEFGSSFTASIYRQMVRTDMSKANRGANLPNGFSGVQNFEYVKWRSRKIKLLQAVKANKKQLPASAVEKMELFRAFYLEDMHTHSIIAGRMVGIEKSLLQESLDGKKDKAAKITAGDMLRMMAAKREKETQFIMETN